MSDNAHGDSAERQAAAIVAQVRERGFKDGGWRFTDAQIWQAILDSRGYGGHMWDNAAVRLVEQVIEGQTPAEAPQYPKKDTGEEGIRDPS